MRSAEVGTNRIGEPCNRDIRCALKIISALYFQGHVRMNVDGNPSTNAKHVEIIRVVETEVIGKDAHLSMVLSERGRPHGQEKQDR
jgi:hypothetical protein